MLAQINLIIHNAKIYTMDVQRPWAEALAVSGRHIAAVGGDEEVLALVEPGTERIDLGGRLVLPGLVDAHIHFHDWCLARQQVVLAGCADKGELLARITAWQRQGSAEGWLWGRGWNETAWPEPALPTRHDLDLVTGGRPALFWRSDMHAAVANSAALKAAGITAATPDPPGGRIGRDAAGEPDGLLWELAINQVMACAPLPEETAVAAALEAGMAELHRLGITAVHDQRMKDQSEGPRALAAYQRLNQSGRLKLRINCNIAAHDLPYLAGLGLRGGFGDDYLRLGHVKFFVDGTMGSRTAWMLAPFEKGHTDEADSLGMNVTPMPQMAAEFAQAAALGFPISVHAIGDRANREVLDLFEELGRQGGGETVVPHRIEHVQIIHPDDVPRLAALGLTASVQPLHVLDDLATADRVLGSRANRAYPFQSLARSGVLLALGSDAPVADPNPYWGMHAALCRRQPEQMALGPWYADQRLSLPQIIAGYTLQAAQAAGWQSVIGSLSPGKRADFIVLDRDLFALAESGISGSELADTQVVDCWFDGEVVSNQ